MTNNLTDMIFSDSFWNQQVLNIKSKVSCSGKHGGLWLGLNSWLADCELDLLPTALRRPPEYVWVDK